MRPLIFVYIVALLMTLSAEPVLAQQGGVAKQDSLALVSLYNSTGGENWSNSDGWLEVPVADWQGVTVKASGGGNQVSKLKLGFNQVNRPDPIAVRATSAPARADSQWQSFDGTDPANIYESHCSKAPRLWFYEPL